MSFNYIFVVLVRVMLWFALKGLIEYRQTIIHLESFSWSQLMQMFLIHSQIELLTSFLSSFTSTISLIDLAIALHTFSR